MCAYVGLCGWVCRCVGVWVGCCLNLELMRDRDELRQKREDYPATVWQVGGVFLPPPRSLADWWDGDLPGNQRHTFSMCKHRKAALHPSNPRKATLTRAARSPGCTQMSAEQQSSFVDTSATISAMKMISQLSCGISSQRRRSFCRNRSTFTHNLSFSFALE